MAETSGEKVFFTQRFTSGMDQRRVALCAVIDAVKNEGISLLLSWEELTLVLDEALTNSMEHGNRWNPEKWISVRISIDKNFIHFIIEDEGAGFIPGNPPSDFEKGNKMSQRGRGLSLIRQFCDPVWDDSGRRIDLPFKLL